MIRSLLKLVRQEPRDPETEPASNNRYASHGFVILAVLVLVLSSAFSPVRVAPASATFAPTDQAMAQLPDWSRGALPDWVRTTQETGLWSGPDERAILFSLIPAGVVLKMQTVVQGGRAYVYYQGDGANRAAGPAWVDASALTPAAAPAPTAVPTQLMQPLVPAPKKVASASPPPVTARYVSIVDEASGAVLYSDKQNERVAPASTTKIATALVTLDRAKDLSTPVTVQVSAMQMANFDGSSTMGIEPGQRVSLETLLYGLMLPSGNDAAEQLALSIAGDRTRFAGWMNEKATSLGLQNTNFISPSGMDTPGHYSSAYDMAMLGRAGMANADFRRIVGATSYRGDGFLFGNLNRLLGYYPGADGVKIGFTDEARKTFVASATRNGHRVFVSIMRSEDLWTDSINLFDWVWDSYEW